MEDSCCPSRKALAAGVPSRTAENVAVSSAGNSRRVVRVTGECEVQSGGKPKLVSWPESEQIFLKLPQVA